MPVRSFVGPEDARGISADLAAHRAFSSNVTRNDDGEHLGKNCAGLDGHFENSLFGNPSDGWGQYRSGAADETANARNTRLRPPSDRYETGLGEMR